jgi:hypothetical protein
MYPTFLPLLCFGETILPCAKSTVSHSYLICEFPPHITTPIHISSRRGSITCLLSYLVFSLGFYQCHFEVYFKSLGSFCFPFYILPCSSILLPNIQYYLLLSVFASPCVTIRYILASPDILNTVTSPHSSIMWLSK